ncbi:hypothetical protein CEXT_329721 [Caerostris extrusa]|uniref:Uncharacterized protein n=1 Tax=Caerostris extrusa TaxID=172846 RepID=A0AAV4T946_CAEEX|nr:hypothetical protein CEXT_329721 [Caerostris extrusa]
MLISNIFQPKNEVTQACLCQMCFRPKNGLPNPVDVSTKECGYLILLMSNMFQPKNGLLNMLISNIFQPKNEVTQACLCQMCFRPKNVLPNPVDVSSKECGYSAC